MAVPQTQGLVMVHVELPAGVKCAYCLLQWRFRKESFAGCDDQQWCRVQGAQTEYYNCADVMIGAVGQPKPSFIQDPIYSASDYGSAYDVATTRTDAPNGTNLVGSTTTQATTTTTTKTTTTNGVPILTIPTGPPVTTDRTTNNPATTNGPVTITANTPGTTQAQTPPDNSRLIVDSNGNAVSGQTTFGGSSNSNVNNRYLLVLLSLIPLFGALGLQNSRPAGIVQPFPVPPSAPVAWATTLPIQFGNTYGFGNFRAGSPAFATTSTYGSSSGKGSFSPKSDYHAGYSIYNAGQNNFGLGGGNIRSLSSNTGVVHSLPLNLQNTNNNINKNWNQAIFNNQNTINKNTGFLNNDGSQFIQNPVVWNNNGVTVNNGFTSHVFPRSISFQNGTPYKPSPNQYSQPSRSMIQRPPSSNEYSSNNHQSGYAPHSNIVPPNRGVQVPTQTKWPTNQVQRVNGLQNGELGQGTRNWQNNGVNMVNSNLQNSGGFGSRNSININRARIGQRLPAPEKVTQRMRIITPAVTQPDNSFNLPGIESAARFQVNGPRQVIETSEPMKNMFDTVSKTNGAVTQNGGGKLNGVFTRTTNRQNTLGNINGSGPIKTRDKFLVNDWYNMLFKRFSGEATRPL